MDTEPKRISRNPSSHGKTVNQPDGSKSQAFDDLQYLTRGDRPLGTGGATEWTEGRSGRESLTLKNLRWGLHKKTKQVTRSTGRQRRRERT